MNETAKYEFTIVVPIYNEQDNLSRVEEQLSRFLPTSCMKACVLDMPAPARLLLYLIQ